MIPLKSVSRVRIYYSSTRDFKKLRTSENLGAMTTVVVKEEEPNGTKTHWDELTGWVRAELTVTSDQ